MKHSQTYYPVVFCLTLSLLACQSSPPSTVPGSSAKNDAGPASKVYSVASTYTFDRESTEFSTDGTWSAYNIRDRNQIIGPVTVTAPGGWIWGSPNPDDQVLVGKEFPLPADAMSFEGTIEADFGPPDDTTYTDHGMPSINDDSVIRSEGGLWDSYETATIRPLSLRPGLNVVQIDGFSPCDTITGRECGDFSGIWARIKISYLVAPFSLTAEPFASPDDPSTITIKAHPARGQWTLRVKGFGVIATGTGDANLTWDGKINGALLPAGDYTLNLESFVPNERSRIETAIVTVGNGPGPSPSPSASPTATPTPSGLGLNVSNEAFSPNRDGRKDTTTISVQTENSQDTWELTVDGQSGTIATGTGSQTFSWDGKLGNKSLPEGQHLLRLRSNQREQPRAVIIDTTKPIIQSAELTGIDDSNNDFFIYTFGGKAIDPANGIVPSGIEPDSVNPAILNFTAERIERSSLAGDSYSVKAKVLPAYNNKPLKYAMQVEDRAGNTNTLAGSIEEEVKLAGLMTPDGSSGELEKNRAYRVQASSEFQELLELIKLRLFDDIPYANGKTHYARSGIPFIYAFQQRPSNGPFKKPYKVRIEFIKQTGGVSFRFDDRTVFENPVVPALVKWEPLAASAPEGEYRVTATPRTPGLVITASLSNFKLSNAPCVTLDKWFFNTTPVPTIPINRVAHILQHILTPSAVKKPNEIFGTYDPYFSAHFPSLIPAPGYDENVDALHSYSIAIPLVGYGPLPPFPPPYWAGAKIQYESVMRIGTAVLEPGIGIIPPYGNLAPNMTAKAAPVVLRNKTVLWVRHAIPKGSFNTTIFPDYATQNRYENSLR